MHIKKCTQKMHIKIRDKEHTIRNHFGSLTANDSFFISDNCPASRRHNFTRRHRQNCSLTNKMDA